tara:strand:+ start:669 stop:866 length:198 start_codon:yes stop_codon:yes gene_type:complete
MRHVKLAGIFAILTMTFSGVLFALYDRLVQGTVEARNFFLVSMLSFLSGFLAYFAVVTTGVYESV